MSGLDPPDDRARALAKEALAQIKRLESLASFCNEDATEAQELMISLCIRNYFIERTESTLVNQITKSLEAEP